MPGESRAKGLLLIAAIVVFAGCSGFLPGDSGEREVPEGLGEVDGVSYDEELAVDPEAGFSEEELDRFVKRAMARVEAVRELEFERPVDVELLSREEYREQRGSQSVNETRAAWENQIWHSLFIVGQDRDATRVLDDAFGEAVQGYYEPGRDRIVIVSDAERPTIDKHTLIHELVHALQEQQFGLEFGQDTRDEQAAYDTLIEGEAELVPQLYLDEWCDQWDCLLPEEATGEGSDPPELDPGVALLISQPYAQGIAFVDEQRRADGWSAVDDLHENPPRSTAAIADDDRPFDWQPEQITIPDRSDTAWERFDHEPVGDTLGAASIYSMFAANDIIENDDPTSYAHPVTEGWTGDRIVPYRSGDEAGFVWELRWEDAGHATQFADAYRELLDSHGALARGVADYVIQDGPFEGAYRVSVDGDRVRIVSGPDRDALDAIHR